MPSLPRITDAQRRARLVRRHHLGRTATSPVEAARGVVAVHSSDPITPHLAMWARVAGFGTEDLHRALHEDRTLWRLHAMRRTLFIVPVEDAGILHAAVGRDVAAAERLKLEGWVRAETGLGQPAQWLLDLEGQVLKALAGGTELGTRELAGAVPELGTKITVGSGEWAGRTSLASRFLFLMAMEGLVVRTRPAGSWRSSQYRWAAVPDWFGKPPQAVDPGEGRAELARRYLARHGPATLVDVRWWTGWTAKSAAAALQDAGAVPVALEGGGEGYVLAGDLDEQEPEPAGAALLPGLDPTPMGWKDREWYLGDLQGSLFDRNGNAGPTVWVDGRVVGGWVQRPDGEVVYRLARDVRAEASAGVAAEAAALTEWLDGVVVSPRFRTPLERELSG